MRFPDQFELAKSILEDFAHAHGNNVCDICFDETPNRPDLLDEVWCDFCLSQLRFAAELAVKYPGILGGAA